MYRFSCEHNFLTEFIAYSDFPLFLFLAVLGVCCCTSFSLVAVSAGYSVVAVCRLLIEVASLIAEHGL